MTCLRSLVLLGCLVGPIAATAAERGASLERTGELTETGDLSARMVEGIHRWLDRKTTESVEARRRFWKTDGTSPEAYVRSIEDNRARFAAIIGASGERPSPRLERFSDRPAPTDDEQSAAYRVWPVRWPSDEEVHGEGLLLEPRGRVSACVVLLGDADESPEETAELSGAGDGRSFAPRLAAGGAAVVIPTLISRASDQSGDPAVAMTNMSHREWIYRQAYHMGRHIVGYEVQKVRAAIDALRKDYGQEIPVGVAGYGEGGLIAFYTAAVDQRISACLVSGYFGPREQLWEEPVYRNVWGLLREFGDAEIASLVVPRALIVEHSEAPAVQAQPSAPDRRDVAALGRIVTPRFDEVKREFERLDQPEGRGFGPRVLVSGPGGRPVARWSDGAVEPFAGALGVAVARDEPSAKQAARGSEVDPRARQARQVKELERHVQRLVARSGKVRDEFFFKRSNLSSADAFARGAAAYRQQMLEELIGRLEDPVPQANPRSRIWRTTDAWTAHEVMLDIWPDVFAWGILLVPRDLAPGERRPVVVCQHGLEGSPQDTIETEGPGFEPYRAFAARLAERGFITFAPHNPYRGAEKYRSLQRKLNPLKASLGSVIVAQHTQILNWLETLPFVDPERIGFYGLSYGGWSASRVPALLERYRLSICSACFNTWTPKVAGIEYSFCYPYHAQYELVEWNSGHTFDNAEMAYLMVPRPFMVERGHHDGVSIDSWVASEYAKVRWLYTQLGLADQTEIEWFNGGHVINGDGSYEFLHRHLGWPRRE